MIGHGLKVNNRWSEEFEWYHLADSTHQNAGLINYVKTDFHYRNEVRSMHVLITGMLSGLAEYRSLAIECHDELAHILGQPEYDNGRNVSERLAGLITGKYKHPDQPVADRYIFRGDQRFWIVNKATGNPRELLIFEDQKVFDPGMYYTILTSDDNRVVLKNNQMDEFPNVGKLSEAEKKWCYAMLDSIHNSN